MEHTASSALLTDALVDSGREQRDGVAPTPDGRATHRDIGETEAPGAVSSVEPTADPGPVGSTISSSLDPRRSVGATRSRKTEERVVALVALATYLTVAILLDFRFHILPLDAVSRMSNGYYVLWSRDPHLAAVGFVWSPLQSFADIPFLLFKPLFPVLATHDLAGSSVSLLAGVGAVHQLHAALYEWGVRRAPRLALTVVFGLNPMVLYYAGNGMSDMLYMFLLLLTTRYFLRWIHEGGLRPLVYAGSALGLAYLNRYEAIGAAGMVGVVTLLVSFLRSDGRVRAKLMTAMSDATILLLPLLTTFVAWATMSYVITGQAFPGVTSQYGTAAQTSEAVHITFATRAAHLVHNVEYLAPLLPLIVLLALVFAVRRRDLGVLAPLAVLGGSLLFDALGLLDGFLEPWYRYFIISVPLEVMLVGCVLARRTSVAKTNGWSLAAAREDPTPRRPPSRVWAGAVGVVVVLGLLGISVPFSGRGIFAHSVQSSESVELGALFLAHPTRTELQWTRHYAHIESIDAYIGGKHFRNGSIVADTYGNCTPQIVTSVPNSKVFVIINDRDFQRILADPLTFGAHYLFVPQPVGVGLVDALNEHYPTLYANGAGFAKLVHQFNADGICAPYRLYRVVGHNGQTAQGAG